MLPEICIAEGISSSGDTPNEEDRFLIVGLASVFAEAFASSLDSEVVVAVIPFAEDFTSVKLIVRTLNRTYN